MAKVCKHLTRLGRKCQGFAVKGSEFCLTHTPGRDRAERNRRGGLARKVAKVSEGVSAPRIESVGHVLDLVNWIIADTWALENGAARSRTLLAAAAQCLACLSVGELEERVKAIEERMVGK